jgi:hypothetical protein
VKEEKEKIESELVFERKRR